MATFGLTDAGLSLPRAADFIEDVQSRYEELTGETPDWERDLVVRSFIVAVADAFDSLSEHVQTIYDNWDENNATGLQLENIAAITPGLIRRAATRSQVTLTLGGTASTPVPSGAIAESPEGNRFVLSDDATVGNDAVFVAETAGALAGSAGAWEIVTAIAGWDTVTAASAASVGQAEETDDELRTRRRLSMQVAGGRSLGAILGAVLALPFITDAVAIENDLAVAQVVSGVSLPANSFEVIVLPDPLTDDQKETLAQLIYALAPMGIASNGSESATVTRLDESPKTIAFSYPTGENVTTQITYAVADGYDAPTVESELDAAVDAFFALLGPGDPVRRLTLTKYVGGVVAGLEGFDVLLNNLSADVEPAANKVATRIDAGSTITEA